MQFDSLRFSAGKGWGRLSEFQVTKRHRAKRLKLVMILGKFSNKERFFNVHFENIVDHTSFEGYRQGVAVNRFPSDWAFHPNVGEEIHFEFLRAVPHKLHTGRRKH